MSRRIFSVVKPCSYCGGYFHPKSSRHTECGRRCYLEARIEKTGDCWIWKGFVRPDGYGSASVGDGTTAAYRAVYQEFVGAIPDNLEIRHSCHVRTCVNPAHLSVGTHQQNMDDQGIAGRRTSHIGLDNTNVKLSEDDVRTIYSSSASLNTLAREFGVCKNQIRNIIKGKQWTHITAPI